MSKLSTDRQFQIGIIPKIHFPETEFFTPKVLICIFVCICVSISLFCYFRILSIYSFVPPWRGFFCFRFSCTFLFQFHFKVMQLLGFQLLSVWSFWLKDWREVLLKFTLFDFKENLWGVSTFQVFLWFLEVFGIATFLLVKRLDAHKRKVWGTIYKTANLLKTFTFTQKNEIYNGYP